MKTTGITKRDQSALTITNAERATEGDSVTAALRTIGDITEMMLMILIVNAQPVWVTLLTVFVFS